MADRLDVLRIRLPVEVAVQVREGHTLEHDSPTMLAWLKRWTCIICGDPVTIAGRRIYGSATTRTCAESVKKWGGR